MRNAEDVRDVLHKDVIIIGNGPSGIALSYMLSGNIPFVVSDEHPDDMLSARLRNSIGKSLVHQDLAHLADGLEGRTTNPISLLLDCLQHPCADIGFDIDSLIEWRPNGLKIDHVVLGKGPPGGSWHTMDPHVLTLSLATWMELPGLPYRIRDGAEKRASARNVAEYYKEYVEEMNLKDHFRNGVIVTGIKELLSPSASTDVAEVFGGDPTQERSADRCWEQHIYEDISDKIKLCAQPEVCQSKAQMGIISKSSSLSNALNYIFARRQLRCKRKYDEGAHVVSGMRALFLRRKLCCSKVRSVGSTEEHTVQVTPFPDEDGSFSELLRSSCTLKPSGHDEVLACESGVAETGTAYKKKHSGPKWLVEVYDKKSGAITHYTCSQLVLANGSSDLPNKLEVSEDRRDPGWFLYDVRSLEIELDLYLQYGGQSVEPVLVVGAGLSAADAIIIARGKNVPVIHVFRNKSATLNRQLPENMYPEYHKVHQMMQDGGSTYPLYSALPEHSLVNYCDATKTVTLLTKDGKEVQHRVSFVVILIGSRPDLNFLPEGYKIGVDRKSPIDSKTNPIDINALTHSIREYEDLYAMGPIVGDNFVRFLPGGALAITADLYKKYGH